MIAHSMYRPITAVVLPLFWCPCCEADRPAAGAPRNGWRCLGCGEFHATASGLQPITVLDTEREVSA